MKQLTVILLLVAFSIQIADVAILYVWFKTNQTTIAAELCENDIDSDIDNPYIDTNKTCQGKCYLSKTIIEQEDNSSNESFIVNYSEIIGLLTPIPLIEKVQTFPKKEVIITSPMTYFFEYNKSIFHPPTT